MSGSQKELWKPEIPFRRRTGAWRRKRVAANIHRLVPALSRHLSHTHTRTCVCVWRQPGRHNKEVWGLFMSLQYYRTAGLKYIDQNTRTHMPTQHIGQTSCIIDIIHCSPLGTVTPPRAPANGGADGETLVTPSGRGLVKSRSQRERGKKKRQTTQQQRQFRLDDPPLGPIVSHLPESEESAFVIEGVSRLVVWGLGRAARRKLKIADLCLANKEQQPTAGCQLGYATHPDSSPFSLGRRSFGFEIGFEAFGWIWCKSSACIGV